MRWSERQQAMLAAMGLKVWSPAPVPQAEPAPLPERAAAPRPVEPARVPAPAVRPLAPTEVAAAPARPVSEDRPVVSGPAARATPAGREPATGPAAATTPGGVRPVRPLTERDARIAALDWASLQAEVSDCRACSLCETRRHTVFGVGHPQAHWMIVGEAPGEQEDLHGQPFVGPAGQLLDQMLAVIGLTREAPAEGASPDETARRQVFIANTLKCRPPHNRNPGPEELAPCMPFLQRQIALVQPRIILASGKFAIEQLTGSSEPVGRLRGRVHRYQGIPVVVSYHPSYLLRQPMDKAKAWDDLCLALDTYASATGLTSST